MLRTMNIMRPLRVLAALVVSVGTLRCDAPCECSSDDASAPSDEASTVDGARDGSSSFDSAVDAGTPTPPACELASGGTNHYVDAAVAASGKGTSWSDAWKSLADVNNVSAGDVVYISGGATSQTYDISTGWTIKGGSAKASICYKVGQDAGHDGIVILDAQGAWSPLHPDNYVDIDGNVGGERHIHIINPNAATATTYASLMNESSTTYTSQRFHYIEFNGGILISGAAGDVVFDHNKWNAVNWVNRALFLQGSTATTDTSVTDGIVHDNEFHVAHLASFHATGDDAVAGGNITIYDNSFFAEDAAYVGNQHQDFIQGANGYMTIYGNYFQDSGQYGVYGEFRYSGSKLHVFNNVFANCQAASIAIGGGAVTIDDVVVANNLAIGSEIAVNNVLHETTYTNSHVHNNIAPQYDIDPQITQSNNLTGLAGITFAQYAPDGGTANDYHLMASSTAAIDKGVSLSTYFSADRDGVARPQGAAWDIGPYEYCPGGTCN